MKTIFITIFQAVEAKNILRTPILQTLLRDPEVRLVLLTDSEDKVQYHKKEFDSERLIYEVVPRIRVRGLDKIFSGLKYLLLRTDTTDLRRRMDFEKTGNRSLYYTRFALNRILARPSVRKIVRMLDFALVRNRAYAPYFEKYRPDLVFMAHLFEDQEIHLLREAKRRGVKTIGFINSWDKVTARCILRLLPEKIIVFNDIVKKEMEEYNEARAEDIFVSGLPQYDAYVSGVCAPRADFFKKIRIDPRKKLIVYAPLGSSLCDSDWHIIDMLHRVHREGEFGNDAALLVRFQPNDFIDEEELKKRPWLQYDYPGIRFSLKRGLDWDMNFADIRHLRDTLCHCSLLICYASSMGIDAAMFDKPVINLNFEIGRKSALARLPMRFYWMTHYKKALETGGMRLVDSESELVAWVNRYLADPSLDREGRKKLVAQQCRYADGKSGERIGTFIGALLPGAG